MDKESKWIDRFLGIALTLVFLINVMPMEVIENIGKTKYNGYAVSIVRNDEERVVAECTKKEYVYSLTMDTDTSEFELIAKKYPVSICGFRFGEPDISTYVVNVDQYTTDGGLVANILNKADPDETYRIDDSDVQAQFATTMVLGIGLSAAAKAAIIAVLVTAGTITVAGATYYTADKVISKLKQHQSQEHYYKAYLDSRLGVMIGPKLKDAQAVTILMRGGYQDSVFAISRSYAKSACKKASPIGRAWGEEIHGDEGYRWHFHPARIINGKINHNRGNHCWY